MMIKSEIVVTSVIQKILQVVKLVVIAAIFTSPVYGDLITAHEGFLGESNKPLAESEFINDELLPSSQELNPQQSDAEILRSLDGFNDELNDGLILNIDAHTPATDNLDDVNELNDNVMMDDSFEDIDFGELLLEESVDKEVSALDDTGLPVKSQFKMKQQGVGVNGDEEALINKLDNSDLMDFDKDLDIWGEEVINKKELLTPQTDAETIELNDIELIDEINNLEGIDFENF